MLATKSTRLFAVASHKSNMRGRQNPRIGKSLGRGEFYNWMLRLLLERVTSWCAHRAELDGLPSATLKVVFSERGGHDYPHRKAYLQLLQMQAQSWGAILKVRQIVPDVIDPSIVDVRRHDDLAGLQLADIVASAFFQAVNVKAADDLLPARALKPRVAKDIKKKDAADFGLLRLPFAHQGDIPDAARTIFEDYGYIFPT